MMIKPPARNVRLEVGRLTPIVVVVIVGTVFIIGRVGFREFDAGCGACQVCVLADPVVAFDVGQHATVAGSTIKGVSIVRSK